MKEKEKDENAEEKDDSLFSHGQILLLAFTLVNAYLSNKMYHELLDLRSSASSAASALNNTLRSEQRLLFFNRVPKAGTTSLAMWMGVLAARNGYQHFAYRITDNVDSEITVMDKQEIAYTVHHVHDACDEGADCSYYKHLHFIDYRQHNRTNPIYVNMVRDPVARYLSWYYYIRSTEYILHTKSIALSRAKTSLDDCVLGEKDCSLALLGDEEREEAFMERMLNNSRRDFGPNNVAVPNRISVAKMVFDGKAWSPNGEDWVHKDSQSDEPSSQLAYFCGFGAECQRGSGGRSEMRLLRAKRNVDMFYAVVGVLEDMPGTIKALEGYIPRYFSGLASDIYRPRINHNASRPPRLSPEARRALQEYLWDEMDFYKFCVQRLNRQLRALEL